MDITEAPTRSNTRAAASAQNIQRSDFVIPSVPTRDILIGAGIVVGLTLFYIANRYGVPVNDVLEQRISTELAVNAFGLMSGSFGALAGLIAAKRLETYETDIPLSTLAVPVLVAGGSTVIGAMLVPTGN